MMIRLRDRAVLSNPSLKEVSFYAVLNFRSYLTKRNFRDKLDIRFFFSFKGKDIERFIDEKEKGNVKEKDKERRFQRKGRKRGRKDKIYRLILI